MTRTVKPGISAVSPPISAQPDWAHPSATPLTTIAATPRRVPRMRSNPRKWLRALTTISFTHIATTQFRSIVDAALDRDLDLGADAIVGGDENRVNETSGPEVEQSPESAQFGVGAGRRVARANGRIRSTRRLPRQCRRRNLRKSRLGLCRASRLREAWKIALVARQDARTSRKSGSFPDRSPFMLALRRHPSNARFQ